MLSSRWSTRKEICLQTTEHFESLWKSCKNSQIKPISFNMLPPVLCHVHSGNVSSSNEPRRVTVNFMFLKLKNGNVPQIYTHSNPSGCMQCSHSTTQIKGELDFEKTDFESAAWVSGGSSHTTCQCVSHYLLTLVATGSLAKFQSPLIIPGASQQNGVADWRSYPSCPTSSSVFLGECCNAVLLWRSGNLLWTTKLYTTFHLQKGE